MFLYHKSNSFYRDASKFLHRPTNRLARFKKTRSSFCWIYKNLAIDLNLRHRESSLLGLRFLLKMTIEIAVKRLSTCIRINRNV